MGNHGGLTLTGHIAMRQLAQQLYTSTVLNNNLSLSGIFLLSQTKRYKTMDCAARRALNYHHHIHHIINPPSV